MILKLIYSQCRLLFQRKTKYTLKTIVNRSTRFEGRKKISSGVFSNSIFGYGSYSGSSLPNCKVGKYSAIGRHRHIIPAFHDYHRASISPVFNKSTILKTENGFYAEIGNDVWIGSNVLIKGGIKIGDGAIVGMGAVVTKDVPPFSIVAGVPAKIIKMIFSAEQIKNLQELKWREENPETIKTIMNESDIDVSINKFRELKSHP